MQEVFEKIIDQLKAESIIVDDEAGNRAVEIIEQTAAEYNNDWIPVEERLPEESLNSVLGWDEYRQRCCFVQYLGGRWILGDDIDTVKIIAWKPLPEPYQPNGEKTKKTNYDMCCESMEAMAQIIDIAKIGWTKDQIMEWLQSEAEV